jgi:hypothetical protein
MWDKPFCIPLPKGFDPAVPNNVTVRVSKNTAAAGIWKPVSIVRLFDDVATMTFGKELHAESNAAVSAGGDELDTTTGWRKLGSQYFDVFEVGRDAIAPDGGSYYFHLKGKNGATIYYKFPTATGKTYKITYAIKVVSGSCISCIFTNDTEDPLGSVLVRGGSSKGTWQEQNLFFTATEPDTCLGFRLTGMTTEACVDKVSIKECGEPLEAKACNRSKLHVEKRVVLAGIPCKSVSTF